MFIHVFLNVLTVEYEKSFTLERPACSELLYNYITKKEY